MKKKEMTKRLFSNRKGATTTSLCSIAVTKIIAQVLEKHKIPHGVHCLVIGEGRRIGECLINDKRLQLISFTGSTSVHFILFEILP
jgi:acyl-CoA reductase-like NAD-dependent aldehyde dehydrogenase